MKQYQTSATVALSQVLDATSTDQNHADSRAIVTIRNCSSWDEKGHLESNKLLSRLAHKAIVDNSHGHVERPVVPGRAC